MSVNKSRLIFVALTSLLAACGGGDDSDTPADDAGAEGGGAGGSTNVDGGGGTGGSGTAGSGGASSGGTTGSGGTAGKGTGGAAGTGSGGKGGTAGTGGTAGKGGASGSSGKAGASGSGAASGSAGKAGASAADASVDRAPDGSRPDVPIPAPGWLHTSGNHIYLDTAVFHGRGANLHDTRSCNACAYAAPNVAEVTRRADELIDNWKANFIRLDLESYAAADSRVQWKGVLDDAAYRADIQTIVSHISSRGAYTLLSLWIEPTATANEVPTAATNEVWKKLADMFKDESRVLYGIVNEPHNDTDTNVWNAMNSAAQAIRDVETQAGTPQHIIAVQGTQQWARVLDYYVTHPITAGGGTNIAYETHIYDPATEFAKLFETPGKTLPVIIGEFGEDAPDELMQRAETAEIPYIAWAFHQRCPPNLIVDNSNNGCGVGMTLAPTTFGQKLKGRLANVW